MLNHLFKVPATIRSLKLLTQNQSLHCCCKLHTPNGSFKADTLFSMQKKFTVGLVRNASNKPKKTNVGNTSALYYVTALGVVVVGFTYAAVPLYRMFCQVSNE